MRRYLSISVQAFLTVSYWYIFPRSFLHFLFKSSSLHLLCCWTFHNRWDSLSSLAHKRHPTLPLPLAALILVSKFPAGTMLCHFFINTLHKNVTCFYRFSNTYYIFCPSQPHLFEHLSVVSWVVPCGTYHGCYFKRDGARTSVKTGSWTGLIHL